MKLSTVSKAVRSNLSLYKRVRTVWARDSQEDSSSQPNGNTDQNNNDIPSTSANDFVKASKCEVNQEASQDTQSIPAGESSLSSQSSNGGHSSVCNQASQSSQSSSSVSSKPKNARLRRMLKRRNRALNKSVSRRYIKGAQLFSMRKVQETLSTFENLYRMYQDLFRTAAQIRDSPITCLLLVLLLCQSLQVIGFAIAVLFIIWIRNPLPGVTRIHPVYRLPSITMRMCFVFNTLIQPVIVFCNYVSTHRVESFTYLNIGVISLYVFRPLLPLIIGMLLRICPLILPFQHIIVPRLVSLVLRLASA